MSSKSLHERAEQVVNKFAMFPSAKFTTDELTTAIESALREVVEECAKVCDEWQDSLQDIDAGELMVHLLKHGPPQLPEGGVGVVTVENLEPHEQRQAEMLGEFREVARKEECRNIAAAIRRLKETP